MIHKQKNYFFKALLKNLLLHPQSLAFHSSFKTETDTYQQDKGFES